jgi:uncharacterized protein YjiS (DUF1127 family)
MFGIIKKSVLETLFVRWLRYIATRKAHRVTIKTLNRLTNRELRDIGITRGEINGLIFRDEDRKQRGE